MACLRTLSVVLAISQAMLAGSVRVTANMTDEAAAGGSGDSGYPTPQFSFNIQGTLCTNPDFNTLKGVLSKFPDTVARLKKEGKQWAEEYNCRLCDITAHQGQMYYAEITCSAETGWVTSGNTDSACFQGNGKPGFRGSGDNTCLPCPPGCLSCEKPGATDVSYMTSRWFKCNHPLVMQGAPEPPPVAAPWECEAMKHRRNHPGSRQWCRYRLDLTSTVQDELVPAPGGKWFLKVAASPCGGPSSVPNATLPPASGSVAGIMQSISDKRAEIYAGNCALCRVTSGGPLSQPSPTSFHRSHGGALPWASVACAYDEFGSAACRTDRGQTGWNDEEGCNPCPLECASCADDSSYFGGKGFKCVLAPQATATDQLGVILAGDGRSVEESAPALPAGFDCNTPEKRKCSSGYGLCMGYKSWCKYRTWTD